MALNPTVFLNASKLTELLEEWEDLGEYRILQMCEIGILQKLAL